jgi:hypothetical protein
MLKVITFLSAHLPAVLSVHLPAVLSAHLPDLPTIVPIAVRGLVVCVGLLHLKVLLQI